MEMLRHGSCCSKQLMLLIRISSNSSNSGSVRPPQPCKFSFIHCSSQWVDEAHVWCSAWVEYLVLIDLARLMLPNKHHVPTCVRRSSITIPSLSTPRSRVACSEAPEYTTGQKEWAESGQYEYEEGGTTNGQTCRETTQASFASAGS